MHDASMVRYVDLAENFWSVKPRKWPITVCDRYGRSCGSLISLLYKQPELYLAN
jgi:hypothetical protein